MLSVRFWAFSHRSPCSNGHLHTPSKTVAQTMSQSRESCVLSDLIIEKNAINRLMALFDRTTPVSRKTGCAVALEPGKAIPVLRQGEIFDEAGRSGEKRC